ncbi:MAG TPA: DUF4190 domain-containing protein [Pilimelia sp.]|nr:DUF4190 domain-containing protein [Pilimelia sp.]
MSYPQQPGNWSDPSWPGDQQPTYKDSPYADPAAPTSGQTGQYPPGYGAGYPGGGYAYPVPAAAQTNGMAIAALICSLAGLAVCVTAPVGAILGHVARRQIRERGEQGDGMALAGIIVGWIVTALGVLLTVFWVLIVVWAINEAPSSSTYRN